MFKVYILKSKTNDKYYVGYTEDLDKRLIRHNGKLVKATKSGVPWTIIYTESFNTKSEAYRRERQIKSYKGGKAFKKLID